MAIQKVVVCGAGTMGSGIAQVSATAGFNTVLYEVSETVLAKAQAAIKGSLRSAVQKGKLAADREAAIFNSIIFSNDLEDCTGDLVIEAIVEIEDVKTTLFKSLAALNGGKAIIASNTSSLSISALASGIEHPERVAGLHFFNPAPLMKLVEVVKGKQTSGEVTEALLQFTKALGKTPVVCIDVPGFIVNRVARPYYIEALRLAEENLSSFEKTDRLLQGLGFKLGPFQLMDLIGNDVNYAVSCSVYEQLGKPERLKPSVIQQEKVERGEYGRKTGKGYYEY
ncbi:MAG TPA: 3-hydroxyacyl-CoA dehydrogenase NAD-binding domain-containing protein [Flavisolibacter sp.]|jgi:3-hydroxybutyryl-CoA dehydrogenase